MTKLLKIGVRMVPIYRVEIEIAENDQDWEYTFIDAGKGKKQMAVF